METRKSRLSRRVGTLVADKWTITGIAGIGGMAAVYRATHRNGHEVAIKVLHPELLQHENLVERFRREGYVANKLKHPAVLPIVDDGTLGDGSPYLVMEFLEGVPLDTHVLSGSKKDAKRQPALSQLEGAYVFRTLAEVLVGAEASGLIHRDIKPANIFRCRDGSIRLLDFGIAMLEQEPIERGTATGVAVGTPSYMAPEQARARKELIGPHSDRFSVAASVLTLMVGKKIRHADTHAEEFALAMLQPFPPAASLGLDLRPSFAAVIDRALRFEIAERHLSAAEMLEDFERAFAGTTIGPMRPRAMSLVEADFLPDSFAISEPIGVPTEDGSASGSGASASGSGASASGSSPSRSSAIFSAAGPVSAAHVATLASQVPEAPTVRPPQLGDTGSSAQHLAGLASADRASDVPTVDRTGAMATPDDDAIVLPQRRIAPWQWVVGLVVVLGGIGVAGRALRSPAAASSGPHDAPPASAGPASSPSIPPPDPAIPSAASASTAATSAAPASTTSAASAATSAASAKSPAKPAPSKPAKPKQLLDNFR